MRRRRRCGLIIGVLGAGTLAGCTTPAPVILRVATFNTALSRPQPGRLAEALARGDDARARGVASIIRTVRPDAILLNEFDTDDVAALDHFRNAFLQDGPPDGPPAWTFAYAFVAPSNSGVPTGLDLDRDGAVDGPGDAHGFGRYPGHYGMVVLSRYPIRDDLVRTFSTMRWIDLPGATLPDDPATAAATDWYDDAARSVLRLSSKGHWDVPIDVDGVLVHLLVSHPTPPVFDGPEDRNGRRNHDEIGFWAAYLDPARASALVDDAGRSGGLAPGAPFVILGDLNADPHDGESRPGAAAQVLECARVRSAPIPRSLGAMEASAAQGGVNVGQRGDPAFDTADFDDERGPGNLRVDYVLPSIECVVMGGGVFWPGVDEPGHALVASSWSSDHRLVWVDLSIPSRFRSDRR